MNMLELLGGRVHSSAQAEMYRVNAEIARRQAMYFLHYLPAAQRQHKRWFGDGGSSM